MRSSALNNKLKSYSALAGSIALISASADAQIIYTDINPDSTINISGNTYNLDLDNDGTFDFTFKLNINSNYSHIVNVTPALNNAVAADSINGPEIFPSLLNSGDTIKSSLIFNNTSYQSMAGYFGSGLALGNWLGASDKYIGLQFIIGAQTHYGWARLDVTATANQFTIKDYAYNTVPNNLILAGNISVGIKENTLTNGCSIYNSNKNIIIQFLNEPSIPTTIKVTSLLGQEIYNTTLKNKETSIDLSLEKTGIYFITLVQADIIYTKKILLQD